MKTQSPLRAVLLGATAALAFLGQPATAEEAWVTSGLKAPESAVFDASRNTIYVSNVAGGPGDKDGVGFISKLSMDGSLETAEWVGGLDAPKGMVLSGDTLFVSDIDRLVRIDVAAGEVTGSWQAEGAEFLNDVAVDEQGRVFVSDMMTNRIYVLEGESLSVWLEDEGLLHPNGLAIDDDQLIVASWGSDLQPDFTTTTPGHLLSVDLDSKAISDYGSAEPIGNLDGLEPDGKGGWLSTDWIGGALYRIGPDGAAEQVLDLDQGSADLEFVPAENLAVIPMMMDDKVVAHKIDQ